MKTKYDIHGALYINKSGNLVDRNNKKVDLICFPVSYSQADQSLISREKFEHLQKEQNIDAILLTIPVFEKNGYCSINTDSRKEVRIFLDKTVKTATELGLYIIIQWQAVSEAFQHTLPLDSTNEPNLTNEDIINDFFHRTAKRYQAYGNVLYEVQSSTSDTTYTSSIIEIIRQYDAYAIIMHTIDNAEIAPLKGYNIACATSLYDSAIHIQNTINIPN